MKRELIDLAPLAAMMAAYEASKADKLPACYFPNQHADYGTQYDVLADAQAVVCRFEMRVLVCQFDGPCPARVTFGLN